MSNTAITAELKRTADACFMNGFSSTHFMRQIYYHPDCKIELKVPVLECYHPKDEPEMLELIYALGYEKTPFGFCKV